MPDTEAVPRRRKTKKQRTSRTNSIAALSLIRRSLGGQPAVHSSNNTSPPSVASISTTRIVSGPVAVNEQTKQQCQSYKTETIKKMADDAHAQYQALQYAYRINPSETLKVQVADQKRCLKTINAQLKNLTELEILQQETFEEPSTLNTSSRTIDSSGEALDNITEDEDTSNASGVRDYIHSRDTEIKTKHRKTGSLPEASIAYDLSNTSTTSTTSSSRPLSQDCSQIAASSVSSDCNHPLDEGAFSGGEKAHSFPASFSMEIASTDTSPQASPCDSPLITRKRNNNNSCNIPPSGWSPQHDEQFSSPTLATAKGMLASIRSSTPNSATQNENRRPSLPQQKLANIMSVEDDEFSDDLYSIPNDLVNNGPFMSLPELQERPGHIAVFLHYLICNSDPSSYLFFLVTETYKTGTIKEMRKWAYEIHSTFTSRESPLRVNIDESTLNQLNATLNDYDKSDDKYEERLKQVFIDARYYASSEVTILLADFRNKIKLGLGSFYGQNELSDIATDKATELKIVDNKIMPHIEELSKSNFNGKSDRKKAMCSALLTFFKQVGAYQATSSKNHSILDRIPVFVSKDKKGFSKFAAKQHKQKVHTIAYHLFSAEHYHSVTNCAVCQKLLWGIGSQGYQCQNCTYNVHKHCANMASICMKRKEKRGMLQNIIRKPSSVTGMHISKNSEARASSCTDDGYMSPNNTVLQRVVLKTDDEEDEIIEREINGKVGKVAKIKSTKTTTIDDNKLLGQSLRNRSPDTTDTDDQKLKRCESLNSKYLRRDVRRTLSDVRVDDHVKPIQLLDQSESSSNSSLSLISTSRSLDSPSNDVLIDTNHDLSSPSTHSTNTTSSLTSSVSSTRTSAFIASKQFATDNDSDFEVDVDLPTLDKIMPKDTIKKLKPKKKKVPTATLR